MRKIILAVFLAGLGAAAYGGAVDLLRQCLAAKKLSTTRVDIDTVNKRLSGASAAEIESLVDTAVMLSAYKSETELSTEDFLNVIDQRAAQAAGISVKEYRGFKERLSRPAAEAVAAEFREKAEKHFKIRWE